jgi:hypothetical protein
MPRCGGKERHSHYIVAKGELFFHTHDHTPDIREFNRLHHHAPKEHDDLTAEQLLTDSEYLKVPF